MRVQASASARLTGTPWDREVRAFLVNANKLVKNMNVVAYKMATADTEELERLIAGVNEMLERLNSMPHLFSHDPDKESEGE